MNDFQIKELIYELEFILKKDKRFKQNGDDKYLDQIRRIYKEKQFGHKPIDLTHLINLNNTVDIGDMLYLKHINKMLENANNTIESILNN